MRLGEAWGGYLLSVAAFASAALVFNPDELLAAAATYTFVACLGLFGASIAYLQSVKTRPAAFSWRVLRIEWLTAIGCALIAYWLAEFGELKPPLVKVGVFFAGFGGKMYLDWKEKAQLD